MLKKIILILCVIVVTFASNIYGTDNLKNEVIDKLDLNSMLDSLEEYTKSTNLDLYDISDNLISGQGLDYGIIGRFILEKLFLELRYGLKAGILILIVIILLAIIKSLELEKDNSLSKVINIVGYLIIVTMMLSNYTLVLKSFTTGINLITSVVEIIAPFLLAVLIATGGTVTSGIIGPVILFVTSLVGSMVTYIILPLLTLSLIIKIISGLSENIKLEGFAKMCGTSCMWVIAVIFALFLGVLELETSITTSVDEVALKTAETAVSNLIPVVGKFVSDSLEVVMGASKIIGKTVGVIGVIILILISIIPILKLVILRIIYFIVSCFAEMLNADSKIVALTKGISEQYKTLLGVLIGVTVVFTIGFAIIINLFGKVSM